jgi:CheY-like chemotaxis protein
VREEETDKNPGRILIVDDDLASLRLLTELLAEQGYTVHPASQGEMALRFVRSTLPDLILLDPKMPGLDGYQVCERLKADERTRDIPVIFLTALADTADKVKGFQAGGVDYITKPLQVEEVLARVKTHVALHALQKQRAAQSARLEQEISERKRAEVALRESQGRYRDFISNSSEGICRIELEQPISVRLSEDEQIRGFFEYGYLGECNTEGRGYRKDLWGVSAGRNIQRRGRSRPGPHYRQRDRGPAWRQSVGGTENQKGYDLLYLHCQELVTHQVQSFWK